MTGDRARPDATLSFIRYYGFFGLHIAIIVAWYLSPLYLSAWYVFLTVAIYYLQNWLFGGCLLSVLQFQRRDRGFYAHYLEKLGLRKTRTLVNVLGHVIPVSLVLIAFLR